jgi:hypothetical protein
LDDAAQLSRVSPNGKWASLAVALIVSLMNTTRHDIILLIVARFSIREKKKKKTHAVLVPQESSFMHHESRGQF